MLNKQVPEVFTPGLAGSHRERIHFVANHWLQGHLSSSHFISGSYLEARCAFCARGLPLVTRRHVGLTVELWPPWWTAACLASCMSALRSSRPMSRGLQSLRLGGPRHTADLVTIGHFSSEDARHSFVFILLLALCTFRPGSVAPLVDSHLLINTLEVLCFLSLSQSAWISHFSLFLEDTFYS